MATARLATTRIFVSSCLRPSPCQIIRLQFPLHAPAIGGRRVNATIVLRPLQQRHQSTSDNPDGAQAGTESNAAKSRAFVNSLTVRRVLGSMTPQGLRRLFRDSPEELVIALSVLAAISGIAVYVVYVYFTYFNSPQFTKYPPPIAKSLRRALYYTSISPDPNLARKYYKMALEQCQELGMDPFSDDVLGIRIQTAAWLEKIMNYQGAILVLDAIFDHCTQWVDWMDKSVAEGTVDASGKLQDVRMVAKDQRAAEVEEEEEEEEEHIPENLWHKRRRLLAKAIGISTKLGQLHSDEHVLEPHKAQERLTWAVENALSELKRRSVEGVKAGEGDWLSAEEIGGALESLGMHFETRSQFHLALPLFFQALRLCENPCHRSTIMNNLAVTFAQHQTLAPAEPILTSSTPDAVIDVAVPITRQEYLAAAQNWARNAYSHSKDVKDDVRTPECDEACAVALSNLGDISSMMGNPRGARQYFKECIELSKKINFQQGVTQAEAGLRKL